MVIPGDCGLRYSSCFSETVPLVLEASSDILDAITAGHAYVKMDSSGIAFLSAGDTSYKLRQQDNSNTQFILCPQSGISEIWSGATGIVHAEQVFTDTIPDDELAVIFEKYQGDRNILAQLVYNTIWSESRILAHLNSTDLYYVENDGIWHRISNKEYYLLLDSILDTCALLGNFNSEEVWLGLNEAGSSISLCRVQYLMSRLSDALSSNKGHNEWPLQIPLEAKKIAIHRGRQILRFALDNHVRTMNYVDFVAQWRQLLEISVCIDEETLDCLDDLFLPTMKNLGIRDSNGNVVLFDGASLPIEINARVNQLFKMKSEWLKEELEEFIRPVLPPGAKPEAVLLKLCRLDEDENGNTTYSSRF